MDTLAPEVLVKLLSKLEQQQLGIASLVCRLWRRASLAALNKLELVLRDTSNVAVLRYWLKSRQQHLQHLQLAMMEWPLLPLELPLDCTAQLRSLDVSGAKLEGSASSALIKLQPTLTSLTVVDVVADHQLLSNISTLTNLRSLCLHVMGWGTLLGPDGRAHIASAVNSMWSSLQQLTALTAMSCDFDDEAVSQISLLSNLQSLDLQGNQIRKGTSLAPLPSRLTFLNLRGNRRLDCSDLLQQTSPSRLLQLQSLSIPDLRLSRPSQLAALTSLTCLDADDLAVPNSQELLAVVSALQHLQELSLSGTFGRPGKHAVIQHLNTALQLPQLTCLDLRGNTVLPAEHHGPRNQPPPAPLLFSTSHMPQLKRLAVCCSSSNTYFAREQLQVILDKFPGLQTLDMVGRIHSSCSAKDLVPLRQLSGLTHLALGGGPRFQIESYFVLNDDILKFIATLKSLEHLVGCGASDVTDLGLMSLTQLTHLTYLKISNLKIASLEPVAYSVREKLELRNKGTKRADVWQQLAELCKNSPLCVKEMYKELKKELKAANKEAAGERKRATAAEQRATAAEQRAAAAEQEVAALNQQLAELLPGSGQVTSAK